MRRKTARTLAIILLAPSVLALLGMLVWVVLAAVAAS